ncbi:unnamed protein product [Thelazia callipaeda]|uniref:F-box domain-containing protein n=1 Tax=Thelazia callipaeda TaxID=103827 RepID=A0A0N5D136_THECL|nr:unnamed protein product [Thelazia callipaeda]
MTRRGRSKMRPNIVTATTNKEKSPSRLIPVNRISSLSSAKTETSNQIIAPLLNVNLASMRSGHHYTEVCSNIVSEMRSNEKSPPELVFNNGTIPADVVSPETVSSDHSILPSSHYNSFVPSSDKSFALSFDLSITSLPNQDAAKSSDHNTASPGRNVMSLEHKTKLIRARRCRLQIRPNIAVGARTREKSLRKLVPHSVITPENVTSSHGEVTSPISTSVEEVSSDQSAAPSLHYNIALSSSHKVIQSSSHSNTVLSDHKITRTGLRYRRSKIRPNIAFGAKNEEKSPPQMALECDAASGNIISNVSSAETMSWLHNIVPSSHISSIPSTDHSTALSLDLSAAPILSQSIAQSSDHNTASLSDRNVTSLNHRTTSIQMGRCRLKAHPNITFGARSEEKSPPKLILDNDVTLDDVISSAISLSSDDVAVETVSSDHSFTPSLDTPKSLDCTAESADYNIGTSLDHYTLSSNCEIASTRMRHRRLKIRPNIAFGAKNKEESSPKVAFGNSGSVASSTSSSVGMRTLKQNTSPSSSNLKTTSIRERFCRPKVRSNIAFGARNSVESPPKPIHSRNRRPNVPCPVEPISSDRSAGPLVDIAQQTLPSGMSFDETINALSEEVESSTQSNFDASCDIREVKLSRRIPQLSPKCRRSIPSMPCQQHSVLKSHEHSLLKIPHCVSLKLSQQSLSWSSMLAEAVIRGDNKAC